MYDIKTVVACLFGLIGFRADQDTQLAEVDTDLRVSRSGLYFEDIHPLIDLEVLEAVASNDETQYPVWDNAGPYQAGAVVSDSDKLYRALADVAAGVLLTDGTKWTETSRFGVWLRNKVKASIKNVLSKMVQKKKLGQIVKTILEDAFLFNGAANVSDKEVKLGRFVGYQFVFKGQQGLSAVISQISTQFTGANDQPLTLYLYHTSQQQPVKTFQITPNKTYSAQMHILQDCLISYSADSIGGAWFMGYYEDDLTAQAMNMVGFDFNGSNCGSCNPDLYRAWNVWYKYVSVLPISVSQDVINEDRTIWNWEQNQYYSSGKTFGLNLHMSIRCDVTPVICSQQIIFQEALATQFAVDMLKTIAFSWRINRVQEVAQQKAMYDLNNRDNDTKGLLAQLEATIDATAFDFSDFNSVCMPCNQASGVTYSSF